MEIAPEVIRIQDIFVNCYILIAEDGVFLIDTGLPSSARLIMQALQQMGNQAKKIRQILITHSDGDHYGGLAFIQKRTQVQAFSSRIESEAIRQGKSSRVLTPKGLTRILFAMTAPLFKALPAEITGYIDNGQVFPVLGGLIAISTPGHTPGHISFFAPKKGILFAGDSINLQRGHPVPSSGANTWDQTQADQSFARQMDLDPRLICAGHCIWRSRK
jgi:glyoxylase-like metal-dependent hydrolase (beta-lactamase superfamily II)